MTIPLAVRFLIKLKHCTLAILVVQEETEYEAMQLVWKLILPRATTWRRVIVKKVIRKDLGGSIMIRDNAVL